MQPATFIFDFDSTLITVESLDELARIALASHTQSGVIMQQLATITAEGMAGTLAFDESLRRRLQLFAARREQVDELITLLHTRLSPSALAHMEWFMRHREHIYVISGGFTDYIIPVVARLGILSAHVYANTFMYDGHGAITGYDPRMLLSQQLGKVRQLEALRLPRPITVIGDGYTDFEMVKHAAADTFWAYTESAARPAVISQAAVVLHDFSDVARPAPQ